MPTFFAQVDAMTGREKDVATALQQVGRIAGFVPCRDGNYDFLIRFDAESFEVVDDFLQTHVRPLPGVIGIHIVTDWDDVGQAARDAREKLGGGA